MLLALLSLLVIPDELPHRLQPIRPVHVRPRVVRRDAYRLRDVVDVYGRYREHTRHRIEWRVHKGFARRGRARHNRPERAEHGSRGRER